MTTKQPIIQDVELNQRKAAAEQRFSDIAKHIQRILGSEPLDTYSLIRWVTTSLDLKGPRFGADETCVNEQPVLDLSEDLLMKHTEFLEPVLWREAYLLHLPNSVRAVNRAADLGLYCFYRYGLKTRKQRQQFLRIWEAASPPIQYTLFRYFPTGGFAYFDKIIEGKFLQIVKEWFHPFIQLPTPLTEDAYTSNLERWMMNHHRFLKPVELKVLQGLYNDPSSSQTELAEKIGLKQPTVSRIIKALAEKQLMRLYTIHNFPVIGLQPLAILFRIDNAGYKNQLKIAVSKIRYALGIQDTRDLLIAYFVIPFRRLERFRQWVKQTVAVLELPPAKIHRLIERSVSRQFSLYQISKKGWPIEYSSILENIQRLLYEDWTQQLPKIRSFRFSTVDSENIVKLRPEDFIFMQRASDAFRVTSRARFVEAEEARKAGSSDLTYRRRVAYLQGKKVMSPPLSIGLLHIGLDAQITLFIKSTRPEAHKILRALQLLPSVSGNLLEDGTLVTTMLLPKEAAVSVETALREFFTEYGRDVDTGIKPAWEAYGWISRHPVTLENYDFDREGWIWVKDTLPQITKPH